MRSITFIHAADLHLDSPMIGLTNLPKGIFDRLKESTFTALTKITDAAIANKVDFVIFAGDLFNESDRSIRAQIRLRKQMERLNDHHIQVYVIHGNHDFLNGNWVHLEIPENVHVFNEEVECMALNKKGIITHLYGFSYGERHVYESKISHYFKQEGADFHIGILHGHSGGESDHGRYAPFHVKELVSKKFDYWALGHIHKRSILNKNPYILYPGNIQGRNKKETGAKGCYHVTLTTNHTELRFIETSDIQWGTVQIDVKESNSFNELYSVCQKALDEKRQIGKGVILTLVLHNLDLSKNEWKSVQNGELLQSLQEEESEEESFVWPMEIEWNIHKSWDRSNLESQSDFYVELFKAGENLELANNSIRPLYDHSVAAKYLSGLSSSDKIEIQGDALQILISLLNED